MNYTFHFHHKVTMAIYYTKIVLKKSPSRECLLVQCLIAVINVSTYVHHSVKQKLIATFNLGLKTCNITFYNLPKW